MTNKMTWTPAQTLDARHLLKRQAPQLFGRQPKAKPLSKAKAKTLQQTMKLLSPKGMGENVKAPEPFIPRKGAAQQKPGLNGKLPSLPTV